MPTPPPPVLRPSNGPVLALASCLPFPAARQTPPYILTILPSPTGVLAHASNDAVVEYAFTPDGGLSQSRELGVQKAQKGVTSVVKAGEAGCLTTSWDGLTCAWDLRTDGRTPATQFKSSTGAPALVCSASSDEAAVAIGYELHHHEAIIEIWDARAGKLAHTYPDSHSDDLTALSFHPTASHVLLSGSVDGLVNTYDVRIADEDDAVLSTGQVGASVARAGWMGSQGEGLWTHTTIEKISLWDASDLSELHNLGDVRDVALQPWRSDFLVDARWDTASSSLVLLTGTQAGDVALMRIDAANPHEWSMDQVLYNASALPSGAGGGHTDIVRAGWVNTKDGVVVTGGEDSRLCLWRLPPQ